MTIEIATPSPAAKTTATNEASGVKGKAGAQEKSQANGAIGFMDILTSLDGSVPMDVPISDAVVPSEPLPRLLNASTDANPDATSLLAQAVQWMAPVVDATVDSDTSQEVANVLNPSLGVLPPVASTTAVPTGSTGQRVDGSKRVGAGFGEAARKDVLTDTLPKPLRKGAEGPSDTAMLQMLSALDSSASVAGSIPTEARITKVTENELAVKLVSAQAEFANAASAGTPKREEQNAMHGVFKPVSEIETVGHSGASSWTGGSVGAAGFSGVVAAPESSPVTDAYVAEQVSYWISNDVKNAELKLDGISESPVEVSISVNGNEAHIAFRTDELRARDALESASLHLKEMLQREGLVLSGVSVGTSGGGNSGMQDRNPRQGGRQSMVIVEHSMGNDATATGRQSAGRALDLFV